MTAVHKTLLSKSSPQLPGGSVVKNPPTNTGDAGSIPGQEEPLKQEMATHSSILAWRIPWAEEPDGLQSTRSQRVGHDSRDLALMPVLSTI